jgi:hypothetical protein
MITRRDKEDNVYANLHRQALENIQALSGNRWSDFNAHDPGVTILEAALYALTEMQYHLQFPFETFLSVKNKIKYSQFGLFPAEKIIAPSLVTTADYEQFIRANESEVKACRVSISDNGKYIIQLETKTGVDKTRIKKHIFNLYHAHRNLCETLDSIVFEAKITSNDNAIPANDDTPRFVPPAPVKNSGSSFPKEYYSFQHHFPDTYGVNEKGAPAGSSPQRKVQILQLKAYLLVFDYLLANILHQEGNIADLLQLSENLPPPYQSNFSIKDMNKLIDTERFNNHRLHDAEFWRKQKSRLLDVLDMLYGEDTKKFFTNKTSLHETNERRVFLIRHFLQWNTNRFRSFNLLKQESINVPEIVRLISAIFGSKITNDIYWVEHILLDNYPEENNCLTIVLFAYDRRNTSKKKMESFMRERLPAHLDVHFLWLDSQKIAEFWKIYSCWREALQQQNGKEIALYSEQLHDFILNSAVDSVIEQLNIKH